MPIDGPIVMDVEASAAEVVAVAGLFQEAGFTGPVSSDIERCGLGDFPYVIYVSVPVTAFLTAFAGTAGKDAYDSLRRFVRDIRKARGDRRGSIVVQDRENQNDGTVLVLSADLPDDAFDALAKLDLDAEKGAYLVWDREGSKGWDDPTVTRETPG
jgi:hypothetical protein